MDNKPTYEELEEKIRILEKSGSGQTGFETAYQELKHFSNAMERIDNAIQASENLDRMLDMVIEQVLQIFQCDRAWLFYPCNPNANSFSVTKESTHPDYPGAKALEMEVPMTNDMADYCTRALAAPGEVIMDPPDGHEMTNDIAIQFSVKTLIIMSLHPKVDDAWMFGLHQCDHHRIWTAAEKKLFQRIGFRINDALGSMLYLRRLQGSERQYRSLFENALDAIYLVDLETAEIVDCNQKAIEMNGYSKEELTKMTLAELHPEHEWQRLEKVIESILEKGFYENIKDIHHLRKDGTMIPVEVNARLVEIKGRKIALSHARDVSERIRTEQALKESEIKFSTLFFFNPAGIVISTLDDGKIIDVNDSILEITGYSKNESIGSTSIDIGFWQDPSDREKITRLLKENGNFNNHEFGYVRKSGESGIGIFSAEIVNLNNQPCIITAMSDITERRKAEEAVIRAEHKWRHILINTPQIGISLDPEARIVFVNEHFLKLTGWKEHEVMGQDWFDLFIPEQIREEVRHVFLTTMRHKDPLDFSTFENEIMTKDGELRNIAWSNVLTKDSRGNVIDITCLGVDLTERKLAEYALRESEERYRQLFEMESDTIFIIENETGDILEVNRAASGIYGYTRDDFLERKNTDLSAEPDKTKKAIDDRKTSVPLRYHKRKDGIVFPVEITATHLTLQGRKVHIAAIRDITLRIKAEQEKMELTRRLQQSQKMEAIGTLAGGIAHDFNNILSPILIHSEMVMEDLPNDDPLLFNLKEIFKAGERARDLVKQILTFSRKEEGKGVAVKITPILKETLKMLRASIPVTIEFQENFETESDTVLSDPAQIHQIMLNLCTNAAHSMRDKGGILKVSLAESDLDSKSAALYSDIDPGLYVKLSVSDTGSGINEKIIQRIYEPYFTTKKHGEGTGMGLALVHGIVKNYGGDITVRSEQGKGTTFDILLPSIVSKTPIVEKTYIQYPEGTERILFVDDEKAAADSISPMLERLGYKVTSRTSSIEALEAFRNDPAAFDLVITDMTMPNMTGKELAMEMISIRPDILIILCTGFSEQINKESAKEMGIKAFVMKPIAMREMAKIIREVLGD